MDNSPSSSDHLTLYPFKIEKLHAPSLVLFLGTPGSGKTTSCRSMLVDLFQDAVKNERTDFPIVHLALYGSKGDDEYSGLVHPVLVHDDITPGILKNNVNRLLRMRRDIVGDNEDDEEFVGSKRKLAESENDNDKPIPDDHIQSTVPPSVEDMTTRLIMDDITSNRAIFEILFVGEVRTAFFFRLLTSILH